MPLYKQNPRAEGCYYSDEFVRAAEFAEKFAGQPMWNDALQVALLAHIAGADGYTGDSPYGFFADAVVDSGTALTSEGKIQGNGEYIVDLDPGSYRIAVLGDYGGGTVEVQYGNPDETYWGSFVDSSNPLDGGTTSNGSGFYFEQPTGKLKLVVSGTTSPDLEVFITKA